MTNQTISISANKTGREVIFRIPKPSALCSASLISPPFWQLAGKGISLVVLPPSGKLTLPARDGAIKVICGRVTLTTDDKTRKSEIRGIAPSAKNTWSTVLATKTRLTADSKDGAVFLKLNAIDRELQGPFTEINKNLSRNTLPEEKQVAEDARNVDFSFVKVEKLARIPYDRWRGFEYYNAKGFSVNFHDAASKDPPVVRVQAWALGVGETIRFRNNSDRSFCEINYCLYDGKGAGGMAYFDNDSALIDPKLELTKPYIEDNTEFLPVPLMHEHGPLWKVERGKKARPVIRENNTVDYPWHAWLASEFGEHKIPREVKPSPSNQSYDIWLSFEFPPSAFQE